MSTSKRPDRRPVARRQAARRRAARLRKARSTLLGCVAALLIVGLGSGLLLTQGKAPKPAADTGDSPDTTVMADANAESDAAGTTDATAAPALSEAEKEELRSISGDEKEIESRFFAPLEFGTAGLRGTMCVGLHQMNIHVIRHATQAFAEVIKAEGPEAVERGVAVCYDCRNHSDDFARETACVMAGNGIKVRLFDAMRPTPEVSFAVREYHCIAGVNVTASHNPKEYNGYKVYWQDGAQLPPHHASAIAAKMEELDLFDSIQRMDYDEAMKAGLITLMGEETDEKFLANVMGQVNDKAAVEKGWVRSMTRPLWRRWPTPLRWYTPPSTAPATS